jgi:biopolymer transport protein ExbB/TolQ
MENFRGIVGERSSIVRGIFYGLLDALFPMALGLIVAIPNCGDIDIWQTVPSTLKSR